MISAPLLELCMLMPTLTKLLMPKCDASTKTVEEQSSNHLACLACLEQAK